MRFIPTPGLAADVDVVGRSSWTSEYRLSVRIAQLGERLLSQEDQFVMAMLLKSPVDVTLRLWVRNLRYGGVHG